MEVKNDETGNAIVPILACVLNQLCIRNDKLPLHSRTMSKFHALRPPAISIKDYLTRIAKYAACSGECFVLALVYIDRIIQSNPTFVVNSLNIHRLLITSVMLAAKFFDDQYFNNAYYAKVGGVPCAEMNVLEVEFLFMTNFTLFVTTDTFKQYYHELCNHATNTACGCSSQRVPRLFVPSDRLGELSYRYEESPSGVDDEEDSVDYDDGQSPVAGGAGQASPEADVPIAMADSPAPAPRRLPSSSGPGVAAAAMAGATPARPHLPHSHAAALPVAVSHPHPHLVHQGQGQLPVGFPAAHAPPAAVAVAVPGSADRKSAPMPYSSNVSGWAAAPPPQYYPGGGGGGVPAGYPAPYMHQAPHGTGAAPASARAHPAAPMQTGSPPISGKA